MEEKLEWVFENIQKLQGVPMSETNVTIMFMSLLKLREVYNELKGGGADAAEDRAAADSE